MGFKKVPIAFTEKEYDDLKQEAKELGSSMASIVRRAVDAHIKERKNADALRWFVESYCKKCNKGCTVGSVDMLSCLFSKIGGEKERKGEKRCKPVF